MIINVDRINGSIVVVKFCNDEGYVSRSDGPAAIGWPGSNVSLHWYINGVQLNLRSGLLVIGYNGYINVHEGRKIKAIRSHYPRRSYYKLPAAHRCHI